MNIFTVKDALLYHYLLSHQILCIFIVILCPYGAKDSNSTGGRPHLYFVVTPPAPLRQCFVDVFVYMYLYIYVSIVQY